MKRINGLIAIIIVLSLALFQNYSGNDTEILNAKIDDVLNVEFENNDEIIAKVEDIVEEEIPKKEYNVSTDIKSNVIVNESSNQEIKVEETLVEDIKIDNAANEVQDVKNDNNLIKDSVNSTDNKDLDMDELKIYKENAESLGTSGRLFIPSVDLSVGLYQVNMEEENPQKVVDDIDSAAYFLFHNQNVIADHNFQKFDRIGNVSIGEKAYIKDTEGTIRTYKLVDKFEGKNLGEDLVDLNDKSIFDGSNRLIMYTCYKIITSSNSVMITIWELEK